MADINQICVMESDTRELMIQLFSFSFSLFLLFTINLIQKIFMRRLAQVIGYFFILRLENIL
jgi:hypothetical protein